MRNNPTKAGASPMVRNTKTGATPRLWGRDLDVKAGGSGGGVEFIAFSSHVDLHTGSCDGRHFLSPDHGPRSVPFRSGSAGTLRAGLFHSGVAGLTAAAWAKPRSNSVGVPR